MAAHRLGLLAAASTAAFITLSTPAYADEQQGAAQRSDQWQQQQERRAEPATQPMGGTSATPMDRSLQGSSADFPGTTFESTYLTPYEVRTPGPRGNIDD
jgi:hypothetical protein